MSNDNTISSIMNLAKLFTPDSSASSKSTSQDKSWPMFPLDAQIHTEPLRVCKSLIPYLPYDKQKTICIFIKLYELISVVEHYSSTNDPLHPHTNFRESENWQSDLLYSVKDNLDPQNAYWVDIFFKIRDVKKILESVQSGTPYNDTATRIESPKQTQTPAVTDNPGVSKEFTQTISPMLDDNQKKMLEMLSTIMK